MSATRAEITAFLGLLVVAFQGTPLSVAVACVVNTYLTVSWWTRLAPAEDGS